MWVQLRHGRHTGSLRSDWSRAQGSIPALSYVDQCLVQEVSSNQEFCFVCNAVLSFHGGHFWQLFLSSAAWCLSNSWWLTFCEGNPYTHMSQQTIRNSSPLNTHTHGLWLCTHQSTSEVNPSSQLILCESAGCCDIALVIQSPALALIKFRPLGGSRYMKTGNATLPLSFIFLF